MVSLGEAFIKLAFDVDDTSLKNFTDGIDKLTTNMFKVAGITAGALYGMDKFIDKITNNALALRDLNIQYGLSQEALQRWSLAANIADPLLDFTEAQQNLATLQKNLSDIMMGKGNVAPFSILNIAPQGKGAIDIIQELHKNMPMYMQEFGKNYKNIVGNQIEAMGLSRDWLDLLMLSDQQFKQVLADSEQLEIPKEANDNLAAMSSALTILHLKIDKATKLFGAMIAPEVIAIIKQLPTWLDDLGTALWNLRAPLTILIGLWGVFMLSMSPLALTVVTIGAILAALIKLGDWMKTHQDIWDHWVERLEHIVKLITSLGIGTYHEAKGIVTGNKQEFVQGAQETRGALSGIVESFDRNMMNVTDAIMDYFKGNPSANSTVNKTVNSTVNVHSSGNLNPSEMGYFSDQHARTISQALDNQNIGSH